jgi:hypothetical protein
MTSKSLLTGILAAAWLGRCAAVASAIDVDSLPFLTGRDRDAIVIVRNESGSSEGTGVVIGYEDASQAAYVLTANHVVDQGDGSVVFGGGRERPAKNVGHSLAKDLCVLSVRRAPALSFLDIDPNVPLAAGETHLVTIGRDSSGLKQHPGTFVEEFDFSQGTVAARCLELEAVALPGFSGGPLLALNGGRPVVVGLLTHGTANRASGPTAEELLTFLAEAGVPLGARGTAGPVAANFPVSPHAVSDLWTAEGFADRNDGQLWCDDDSCSDPIDNTLGEDKSTAHDESQPDVDRAMADFEARLDAIAREVDAEIALDHRRSAPARQPPPSAPRRDGGRQSDSSDVQVVEIPGYGVRIVIRSR